MRKYYFTCRAGQSFSNLKTLKFKVQKPSDCVRLLKAIKAKNALVLGAAIIFEYPSKPAIKIRFNSSWYLMTGELIPILRDVKYALNTIR